MQSIIDQDKLLFMSNFENFDFTFGVGVRKMKTYEVKEIDKYTVRVTQ